MALCAGLAVAVVPADSRAVVAWCGVTATLLVALAAAESARKGHIITALRRRFSEQDGALRRRLGEQEAETIRLAKDVLPVAINKLHHGNLADDVMKAVVLDPVLDPQFADAHRLLLRSVLETVQIEEDLRDCAQRAFVNIARRVQAIVHQQAQDLREMEDRHGADPEVFGDLLHLDHGNALVGRLADSIAVMGGSRPGRQWQRNVPLFNVLRGAMSRILDYRRVDLHSVADVAIVGPSVEPLIHAVAELLDNACRYSPPETRVHLTAIEVQSGIAIEIEDAGVGLTGEARKRIEDIMARASAGLDLNDLGETPRLGLAVVGRLAERYSFTVSLRNSAYGGVRAVLVAPQGLITTTPVPGGDIARAAVLPPPKPVRRATPSPAPTPVASVEERAATHRNGSGLPQRRRRMPRAAPPTRPAGSTAAPSAAKNPYPETNGVRPGLWLAAFHRGIAGEGPMDEPGLPHSDQPSAVSDQPQETDKGE